MRDQAENWRKISRFDAGPVLEEPSGEEPFDTMIIRPTSSHSVLAVVASAIALHGCSLEKSDDVSEYREALPEAANVSVAGPEQDAAGSRTLSAGSETRLLAGEALPGGTNAQWYRFTRSVRDGVNVITAGVLGSVWFVVHTRPTTVGDDFAEWGPYTDALDPVTWRLRVERVASHEYDYRLAGRPRASKSDADFVTVLEGRGYGREDPRHGDGRFTVDLDASRALDPDNAKPDDSGTVTIIHDLPPESRRKLGALPREITAELDPAGESWLTIVSKANQDGTGQIEVSALADTEDTKDTALEDISILSRWRADGAGRADVVIAEGDVPAAIVALSVTECWGSDFSRVYYTDSIGATPAEGDASACAYDAE
jgi:hypothetical protein